MSKTFTYISGGRRQVDVRCTCDDSFLWHHQMWHHTCRTCTRSRSEHCGDDRPVAPVSWNIACKCDNGTGRVRSDFRHCWCCGEVSDAPSTWDFCWKFDRKPRKQDWSRPCVFSCGPANILSCQRHNHKCRICAVRDACEWEHASSNYSDQKTLCYK